MLILLAHQKAVDLECNPEKARNKNVTHFSDRRSSLSDNLVASSGCRENRTENAMQLLLISKV